MHLIFSKINGEFWNISNTKLKDNCFVFKDDNTNVGTTILIALKIGHASYLVYKDNLKKTKVVEEEVIYRLICNCRFRY
jgi:hypothetical protein